MLPMLRAVSQLNDPVFLGVVWRSLLLSLIAFLALLAGCIWLAHDAALAWVGHGGWLGWLAGALGGVGAALAAVWLFVPAALLIATLYIDRIAGAVERHFYPGLPAPRGAPLAVQAWDGVVLAGQVLVLQGVALVLTLLLPGVGLLLGWLVTGWAIGRGLFVAVAMRRMSRSDAILLYGRQRLEVVVQGVALALAATLPPLNLLVPVVGTAAMVHVMLRR